MQRKQPPSPAVKEVMFAIGRAGADQVDSVSGATVPTVKFRAEVARTERWVFADAVVANIRGARRQGRGMEMWPDEDGEYFFRFTREHVEDDARVRTVYMCAINFATMECVVNAFDD